MEEIINNTKVYCNTCKCLHNASVLRMEDKIIGRIRCPEYTRTAIISDEADIYLALMRKSFFVDEIDIPGRKTPLLSHINITNDCNFRCPICYSNSGAATDIFYMSLEGCLQYARKAKEAGSKEILLLGGEPTMHPDLLTIVKAINDLGIPVVLVTNGFLLGQDPDLAKHLKNAGVRKVSLQIDTFNEETHRKIRGNTYIKEKIQAVKNLRAANLRLGLICTVTSLNLSEVGAIVKWGISLTPQIRTIVFQVAAKTGRYEFKEDLLITREHIIKHIVQSNLVPDMTYNSFWPLPLFRPWNLYIHPDCGVNAYVLVKKRSFKLLDKMTDIQNLFQKMQKNTMKSNWISRNIIPLYYLLSSTRPRNWLELLETLKGFLTGKGNKTIVIIGAGSFINSGFYDQQRIMRCASAVITDKGFVSPCIYYGKGT